MASARKISELPPAQSLTGSELVPIVQNGGTLRTTVSALAAIAGGSLAQTVSVLANDVAGLEADVSTLDVRVNAVSVVAAANTAAITSINAAVSLKANRTGDFLTDVQYIDFNTSASIAPTTPGEVAWNVNDGTLDVGIYGGEVLQVGQETLFYIKNGSGSTITKGQLVMATSALGASGKIVGAAAVADGTVSPEYFLGIATQNIDSDDFGYVTHFGLVRGFNASGSPYGQTWADGQILYANASVAGGLTNVAPAYPGFSTPLAIVINAASGGSGSIFVRMKSGEYLRELHDVNVSTVADNDILVYNAATSAWTNSPALTNVQTSVSALTVRVSALESIISVVGDPSVIAAFVSLVGVLDSEVSTLTIQVEAVSAATSVNAAQIAAVSALTSANAVQIAAVSAITSVNGAAITSINAVLVSILAILANTNYRITES